MFHDVGQSLSLSLSLHIHQLVENALKSAWFAVSCIITSPLWHWQSSEDINMKTP